MKTFFRLLALLSLFALCSLAEAQLAVSNIRPVQRASSKMGDIDYDVTGTTSLVTVALQISADGGSTWAVPATALTEAIGGNVTPASNLRITWDSGADWNQQLSSQMKFRISVAEGDVPTGFALIPAGSFTMGDALDGLPDAPAHTVTVSAFCMAKNLVTKADWDTVRTWALSNGYTDLAAGSGKASTHPVETISWYQMVKYCNARSEKEGLMPVYYTSDAKTKAYIYKTGSVNVTNMQVKWTANGYRLPTEAEWEKAARGGLSGKRFPWGDTISQTQANYYGSTSSYSYDLGPNGYNSIGRVEGTSPGASPVGSFAANGYGLYDMAGNVPQWCWDWYEDPYDKASSTNPRGSSTGSYRVFRGGHWNVKANQCRVAYRDYSDPSNDYNGIGFRVARSLSLNSEMGDSANVTWDTRDAVGMASSTATLSLVAEPVAPSITSRVGEQMQLDLTKFGSSRKMKLVGALPKGLTFNSKTGILGGKITGKAGRYPLKLKFLSGKTILSSIDLPLMIAAYPSGLAGTFKSLLYANSSGLPVGMVSVTVVAPGIWSASLDLAGRSRVLSKKGTFALDPTKAAVDLTIPFSAAMKVHLRLDPSSALVSGDYPQGIVEGFRMASGSELPTGNQLFTLTIDQGPQDKMTIPAGLGRATGTVSNKGAIALTGQLGDGKAFKIGTQLSATGQAIVWMKPYKNPNSFVGGIVSLRNRGLVKNGSDETLIEGLYWYRVADSREPSYPNGFGPLRADVGIAP